jgi:hypothetical protein
MLPDVCQPYQETNKLTAVIIPNPVIQKIPLQRRTVWCYIRKQSLFVYRITRNTYLYILCQLTFSGYPDWGFSVPFPQLCGKYHGIPRKDRARSALYVISCVVLCIIVSIVLFCTLFVCKCVLYYCHRVSTQLQLNVSYITSYMLYDIVFYHIYHNCTAWVKCRSCFKVQAGGTFINHHAVKD